MTDPAAICHAHMRALVQRFGALDAFVELLNARWGGGHSKSVLSRKMTGSQDWTLPDIIAIEDGLREYPVSRALTQRFAEATALEAVSCMVSQAGTIAKETGEAVASILAADRSARGADPAQAVKEIDDALTVLAQARQCLLAGARDLPGAGIGGGSHRLSDPAAQQGAPGGADLTRCAERAAGPAESTLRSVPQGAGHRSAPLSGSG